MILYAYLGEEAIWVSRRIGGTYHPRVSLVSKGLGHISTTLDPPMVWTFSSSGFQPYVISSRNKSWRILCFYNVILFEKIQHQKGIIENQASRPDISRGFILSDEEDSYLQEQWHRTHQGIVDKMLSSDSYKDLVKDKTKFRRGLTNWLSHPLASSILGGLITTIIGGIIIFLSWNELIF